MGVGVGGGGGLRGSYDKSKSGTYVLIGADMKIFSPLPEGDGR